MELDPITADFPSRTAREEDEEAAEALGPAPEPVAFWTPEARAASVNGRFKTPLMVVATTPESCALLRSAAEASSTTGTVSLIGAIMLPGLSAANNTLFALSSRSNNTSSSSSSLPAPTDRVCAAYSVRGEENSNENNTIVLVLCQFFDSVPEERAFGLAAALGRGIDAASTLVLGSLPSHAIPGASGAEVGGSAPLYRLQTRQALPWAKRTSERSASSIEIAALPPGAAASGFPAAVVGRAAAEGKAAMLLARADARAGAPAAEALRGLASGIAAAVSAVFDDSESSFASLLRLAGAKASAGAAAAAAAAADAASARAAVYA